MWCCFGFTLLMLWSQKTLIFNWLMTYSEAKTDKVAIQSNQISWFNQMVG